MQNLAGEGAEFGYEPTKHFDGTINYTFGKGGNATRTETAGTRNAYGQTLISSTREMVYKFDLLVSMKVENTDAKGQVTETVRQMEYHDGAKFNKPETQKVKTLRETTVTSSGETKTLLREGM